MHAIGLGALQQGDVAQRRRGALDRAEKVAQHQVVGADLLVFLPARDQARPLVERGIDQVGDAGELGAEPAAGCSVGEVERMPSRAESLVRLAT